MEDSDIVWHLMEHYMVSAKLAQLRSKHEETWDQSKLRTFCKITSLKHTNMSNS